MSKKQSPKIIPEEIKNMPLLWLFVRPGKPSKNGRDKEDKNDRSRDPKQS